jgi:hypothetical protein
MALAFTAFGALAEERSDFSASAAVTPANADALQRFTLPVAAYRDTRRDLADVRVFNANGEPVPIAFAGDPDSVREATRVTPLPLFPVSSLVSMPGAKGTEVNIRMQDGTLVEVRGGRGAAKRSTVPVAYLLDASQLTEPLAALAFYWSPAPGTEVVPITVEASEDLQSWRAAGRSTLWHLRQGASEVSQGRVRLVPASRAKYYRVTWSAAPDFRLQTVQGELEGKVTSAPRESLSVAGRAGEKPGEFVFDLGARLPVEALRIVPAEPNSIASFNLFTRDPPATEWRRVTSGIFYRLQRNGHEIESEPMEIGRRSGREWMARVDPRLGGIGATPPKLEVRWRSAQVVFVARGPGPFHLAFGDPDAKPAWVPVSSLVPGYKRGDELKLAEAAVGAVEGGPPARVSFMPARIAELGPRKVTLWSVLILAVAMLAFMAWQLKRK